MSSTKKSPLFVKTVDREELTLLALKYTIIEVFFIDVKLQELYIHVPAPHNEDAYKTESPRNIIEDLNDGSHYVKFEDTKAFCHDDHFYFTLKDQYLLKYKPWNPEVLTNHIALRFE